MLSVLSLALDAAKLDLFAFVCSFSFLNPVIVRCKRLRKRKTIFK